MKQFDTSIYDYDYLITHHLITNGYHLPYNPDLISYARQMRKNPTECEKLLWYKGLRRFKPKIHRQKVIINYIVDFYCTKRKLIIEIDGGIHQYTVEKDKSRDMFFMSIGIRTVRFTNEKVLQNTDYVLESIHKLIHPTRPPLLSP